VCVTEREGRSNKVCLLHSLTVEIRLKIIGTPDLPDFWGDPLSDGNSDYSRETLFKILETPEKTCLICMGTPVKTCWNFWQS